MAIEPAQVDRREDADDGLETLAIFDGQVIGRTAAHGDAGDDVRFTLRPDREVLHDEVPDILHDEVFEAPGISVHEKAAGGHEARFARQATVRNGNDHRR